jgi:hypothetical protein
MFAQFGAFCIAISIYQNGFSTLRLSIATARLNFFTHPLVEQTVSLLGKVLHQRSTYIVEMLETLPQIGCDLEAQQRHRV